MEPGSRSSGCSSFHHGLALYPESAAAAGHRSHRRDRTPVVAPIAARPGESLPRAPSVHGESFESTTRTTRWPKCAVPAEAAFGGAMERRRACRAGCPSCGARRRSGRGSTDAGARTVRRAGVSDAAEILAERVDRPVTAQGCLSGVRAADNGADYRRVQPPGIPSHRDDPPDHGGGRCQIAGALDSTSAISAWSYQVQIAGCSDFRRHRGPHDG